MPHLLASQQHAIMSDVLACFIIPTADCVLTIALLRNVQPQPKMGATRKPVRRKPLPKS